MSNENYLGNPNLFKAHTKKEYTEHEIREIAKCMDDPIYFIKNYIKIVNIDEGLVPFDMYKFQEKMVDTFHNNRFSNVGLFHIKIVNIILIVVFCICNS